MKQERVKVTLLLDPDDVEQGAVAQALSRLQAQQRDGSVPYGTVQAHLRCWVGRGFLVSTLLLEQAAQLPRSPAMEAATKTFPSPQQPTDEPLPEIGGLDELFGV
jgi:hypothetical protein